MTRELAIRCAFAGLGAMWGVALVELFHAPVLFYYLGMMVAVGPAIWYFVFRGRA
jgi:hypothetical protein